MQTQDLDVQVRTGRGKAAARQLRMQGKIPGVFHGVGTEATSLSLSPKQLIAALSTEYGRNAVIRISLANEQQFAMVKELQIHPVTRQPLHVDLYLVDLNQQVLARVPFAAEGRAKGVVAGGEINLHFRELPVRATPENIPAVIKVDVTEVELNEQLFVRDLALPEGVEIMLEPDRSVLGIFTARKPEPTEEEQAAEQTSVAGAAPDASEDGSKSPASS